MHESEHDVDVQAATIRRQWGQIEAGEASSMKLVEEVRNFLREIAQLTELAKLLLITESVPTISCHLNTPQPILFHPPP